MSLLSPFISGILAVAPAAPAPSPALAAEAPLSTKEEGVKPVDRVLPRKVLVFSKTAGFRHDSIPNGIVAIKKLGAANKFEVEATEDSKLFTAEKLAEFGCVIFLSTTMDVLNDEQQKAFEGFIQSGGGYVGIHAATDTEYTWPWYTRLVGGQFASHPKQQKAAIDLLPAGEKHPSTSFLPKRWERFDEWYNFKNLNPTTSKLLNLDETSYKDGKMGKDHPVAWCHDFDGGRAWYTALGHTKQSYEEELFLKHITEGILWSGRMKKD